MEAFRVFIPIKILLENNPVEVNFTEPVRGIDTPSLGAKIPSVNFLSNDFVLGTSGGSLGLLNSLKNATAGYNVYLNTSEAHLDVSRYVTSENPQPFDSLYLYNGRSYDYLFIDFPLAEDYVLDKAGFRNENLESHELVVSSQNLSSNTTSHLSIFGAISQEEALNDRFHGIYHFNKYASLDTPMQYDINNSFYSYRHALYFANYYTERKGPPIDNYQIPDVTLDYTFANNVIDLTVEVTEHVVGKVECMDFDNLTYVWNITFKSKDNEKIIIPKLPESISHPSKNAHESNTLKVEKVELLSYQSITTYDDYIQNVFKDQKGILDFTDWYQLIFSSRTGNFNRPIEDAIFQ